MQKEPLPGLPRQAEPSPPAPGTAWRHRNGNLYVVLLLTNVAVGHTEEHPHSVVYLGADGSAWSWRVDDWHRSFAREPASDPAEGYLLTAFGQGGAGQTADVGMYRSPLEAAVRVPAALAKQGVVGVVVSRQRIKQ